MRLSYGWLVSSIEDAVFPITFRSSLRYQMHNPQLPQNLARQHHRLSGQACSIIAHHPVASTTARWRPVTGELRLMQIVQG